MKLVWLLIVSTILYLGGTSCSPITKTQKKAVGDYFQTIARFPEYPRELKHYSSKIKMNRTHIFPQTYNSDSLMIETLVNSYEVFQKESQIENSLNSDLNDMAQYITRYYSMTPDGFWLYKTLSSGTSLFGQFLGFGNIANKVTRQADQNKLIKVGGKKIKNHIINGESTIQRTTERINHYADSLLNHKLKKEDKYLKDSYRKFLRNLRSRPDAYEYYSIYNEIFMRNFRLLHHTQKLARQLKKGSLQVMETHQKLSKKLKERNKLERDIPELYDLLHSMNRLQKTMNTLHRLEETVPGTIKVIPMEHQK
ncbi:MAG: hypothetical protein K9I74_07880 [Bacteroidales bacterium]|nr:hypothetical protein [Bacteroidales bacterium]